ncbi:protein MRG1-like [Myzus persicae]|uniref:protein MRG1-like n=1 Tax=Myzus persicae TaxID=13164 RepID=UPI000B938394|nr:protein MRG1-like [Myzus persicae]
MNRKRKFEFAVGDKVLAYDNKLLYEAKCLKRGMTMASTQYLLHFFGFNSKFDEWIYENDILEMNEINLAHKNRLLSKLRKPAKRSKNLKKSKKSNTTKNASPKPALKKTDKISNIIPNINPYSKLLADKLHNIAVPLILQKALFLDFVMNNTFQKILKFPEKHFLAEILHAFTQSTYFDDDSEKKSSTMLCVTLMQYFNSYVSKHLLYVNEKRFKLYIKGIQYFQQRSKNQPNITYIFKKKSMSKYNLVLSVWSLISIEISCSFTIHFDVKLVAS